MKKETTGEKKHGREKIPRQNVSKEQKNKINDERARVACLYTRTWFPNRSAIVAIFWRFGYCFVDHHFFYGRRQHIDAVLRVFMGKLIDWYYVFFRFGRGGKQIFTILGPTVPTPNDQKLKIRDNFVFCAVHTYSDVIFLAFGMHQLKTDDTIRCIICVQCLLGDNPHVTGLSHI